VDRLHLYYVVGGQFDYCVSGKRFAICQPHIFDPYRKILPFKDNIRFMFYVFGSFLVQIKLFISNYSYKVGKCVCVCVCVCVWCVVCCGVWCVCDVCMCVVWCVYVCM
jgi:hypothetical protein